VSVGARDFWSAVGVAFVMTIVLATAAGCLVYLMHGAGLSERLPWVAYMAIEIGACFIIVVPVAWAVVRILDRP
jgi:cation transporter-like permease